MKLIIDIPEEDFKWIQTHRSVTDYQITKMLYKRVINGTPFDSVIEDIKTEIEAFPSELTEDGRRMVRKCRVLEIIDKHISEKEN